MSTGSSASRRSSFPLRDLVEAFGISPDQIENAIHEQFRAYRATLQDDRRHLLERFELVDVARKVVGVGSVGTRAFIVLLQGRDQQDPLFLQVKEATASVLEDHLPKSRYRQPGERVVQGQRMMQAASDIFLGWTKGVEENRYLYWRQLRDMKGSAVVETMVPTSLTFYARICGQTLARAHARSGDPIALAAYLGKKDRFDQSITDFSERYADQNDQDYEAFIEAIRSGRLQALEGVSNRTQLGRPERTSLQESAFGLATSSPGSQSEACRSDPRLHTPTNTLLTQTSFGQGFAEPTNHEQNDTRTEQQIWRSGSLPPLPPHRCDAGAVLRERELSDLSKPTD